MPHSPYTVHPPIENLNEYKKIYEEHLASWLKNEISEGREEELLDMTATLLRHCRFFEGKLGIKKWEHGRLAKRYDELEEQCGALEEQLQTQRMENTALKRELEKAEVVTGTDEQLGSDSDDTGVESDSRDVSGGKPEEGDGSVNPRKRDAEVDNTIDGRTMKKGRVANVRDNSMVSEGAADNSLVSGK